jgi:hypothetical protein
MLTKDNFEMNNDIKSLLSYLTDQRTTISLVKEVVQIIVGDISSGVANGVISRLVGEIINEETKYVVNLQEKTGDTKIDSKSEISSEVVSVVEKFNESTGFDIPCFVQLHSNVITNKKNIINKFLRAKLPNSLWTDKIEQAFEFIHAQNPHL